MKIVLLIFLLISKVSFSPVSTETISIFKKNGIFIIGTVYCPLKTQQKQFIRTASGKLIRNDNKMLHERTISVSQDLLKILKYGDSVELISEYHILNGIYTIQDCMDIKMKNRIDVLCSREEVKLFKKGVYGCIFRRI